MSKLSSDQRRTLVINVCAAYMRIYERYTCKAELDVLLRQYSSSKVGKLPFNKKERVVLKDALDNMLCRRSVSRKTKGRNLDKAESCNPVLAALHMRTI